MSRTTSSPDDVVKDVRCSVIGNIIFAKKPSSRYSIRVDSKNGKLVISENSAKKRKEN